MSTDQELTFKSTLNWLSLLTLEEMSIVALAIELLEVEEIKKIYCEHFLAEKVESSFSDSTLFKLASVFNKSLQLPDILRPKLVRGFHWIGDQYFNWINFVVNNLPLQQDARLEKIDYITHIMNSVKWSMGVIDKEKSVHQLFSLEDIKDYASIEAMFKMASRFCLEDDLKIFWKRMLTAEKRKLFFYCKKSDFISLYWICKIKRDMTEFINSITDFRRENEYLGAVMDNEDPYNYGLVLHIFKGDISGVKYFIKLADFDIQLVHIIRIFLNELDGTAYHLWRELDVRVNKLFILLKEIENKDLLKDIFHEFFQVFLKISVKYWPWHKSFFHLLKMFVDGIDQVLLYDLITQLLEDINTEKSDSLFVKILWKNAPNKLKKSFCSFISHEQKNREVGRFWQELTIEVLDMILKDEELRNILTPYENYGLEKCIREGKYDLIEFWLQKCLVSEEAIISYLESFIQTKSVTDIISLLSCGHKLSHLNQFLNWAFKYEDFMNRDEIFKVKDQAINENIIELFVRGLKFEEWEDLKKVMDWMLRNRNHEYENQLINWKQKAVEEFFRQRPAWSNFNCSDFNKFLCDFLSYGINDSEKIKVMMREVNVYEVEVCLDYLRSDFVRIDCYLRFLECLGKDIFLIKKNVLHFIFNISYRDQFTNEKFCENIRKLLYWNCESDDEMKTKVEEIKKEIIDKYALEKIVTCLQYNWDIEINNIVKFLFEGKLEDEEWSKMLFNLKKKVIQQLERNIYVWKEKNFYDQMLEFANFGEENDKVRKENWEIKRFFIQCLKNIKFKITPKSILDCTFVRSFLEGDKLSPDFENILWDLKEFLLSKLLSGEGHMFTRQLLGNRERVSDFLNYCCSDEARIQDLKIKIFDERGAHCCLFWIKDDQLQTLSDFLDWCFPKNSNRDLNIFKLKKDVINIAISNHSKDWGEEYFERLDKFLLFRSNKDEKDLKKINVADNYVVKSCAQCLVNQNLNGLTAFIKWVGVEGGESIKNLKKEILTEILDVAHIKRHHLFNGFGDVTNKFLYDYDNPDPLEIACIKLDLVEVNYFKIFEKVFAKNEYYCFINRFLSWCFDRHVRSDKYQPRAKKLIGEMYKKLCEERGEDMTSKTNFEAWV